MAIYRVEVDVSFTSEQDALDLVNHIEDIKTKAYKPTGQEKIICYRQSRHHKCTHSEVTPVQCKDYVNVDFEKVKKVHTEIT